MRNILAPPVIELERLMRLGAHLENSASLPTLAPSDPPTYLTSRGTPTELITTITELLQYEVHSSAARGAVSRCSKRHSEARFGNTM
jgi:hypothetical protein